MTILFTDVEGSSDLVRERGDERAKSILRRHDEEVRNTIKAHDDTEVEQQAPP